MTLSLAPLWISLKTALVATAIATITGVGAARWMYGFRGKSRWLWDGLFTLPLVLPPIVTGFLLLLLFGRNSPLGRLLDLLGIQVIFTWTALAIAATVVAFPLAYKTSLAAFEQVDDTTIAAAQTLGASNSRIFWQILVPLAWPGIVAGIVLAFARALGEFWATVMVAGSIPGRTVTLPIAIYLAAEGGRMGQAVAWTLVAVAVTLGSIGMIHISGSNRAHVGAQVIARWTRQYDRWWHRRISRIARTASRSQEIAGFPASAPPSQSLLSATLSKQLEAFPLSVSLDIGDRPFGILGHSGSGKSMTLRCLAGLATPDSGRIVLNGRTLFDSKQGINLPSHQRRIGIVFQNYALFPHMSVADNITFGLQDRYHSEQAKAVSHLLSLVQLDGLKHRYPHQLSGGQQQRVALARALAISPDALLLDEPLSALDNYLRSQIEQLLSDVFATYGGAVVFVTHKLEEAYRVCNRLIVLDNGQVLANGPKADIFEHPGHYQVAKVTECKNFSEIAIHTPHSVTATDWNLSLHVDEQVPDRCTHIGIRAHHLTFRDAQGNNTGEDNTFPCWLAGTSEMQHRVSLFLKLHAPPTGPKDYHLRAELYKDRWREQRDHPFPWYIHLDPRRIMPLRT
ncbi:MAG: molybdate ABC transporter permease subunit [Cyanobacteria bacterium P01_G01_bin.4]